MSAANSIGLSSLLVSQRLLDLTGQNIANAGSPGYHRQVASLAMRSGGVEVGLGVEITQVRRLIDLSLEHAITRNTAAQGDVDSRLETLRRVENSLHLGDGSAGALLDDFLNQAVVLAGAPDNLAQQRVFLNKAVALADQLNTLHTDIGALRTELTGQLRQGVEEVNRLATQIADLNGKISAVTIQGGNANDLSDQRDQLINELAGWIDVRVVEQKYGVVNVQAAGVPLVLASQSLQLQLLVDAQDQAGLSPKDLPGSLSVAGGKLGGWLEDRNEILPQVQEGIEVWTRSLVQTLDRLQTTGLGPAGSFPLLQGLHAVDNVNLPLAQAGLVYPPQAGSLFVTVTDLATGQRTLHELAIDPATQSLQDVAAAFSALPHLQGVVNTQARTLTVVAQPGYAFDFAGRLPSAPQTSTFSGTAQTGLSGLYQGTSNDQFSFTVVGSGTVGVTPNLTLEARNQAGQLLATFNIGQGYEPGSSLGPVAGVQVRLSAGSVNNGEAFGTSVVSDPDAGGLLAALGLNVFFQGSEPGVLKVRTDLLDQPNLLSTNRSGLSADGSNWHRLLAQADAPILPGGVSLREYYGNLAAQVGAGIQDLDQTQTAQQALGQGLEAQRQSVSGVDPNEELTRMLQYQRSFQMAARYISAINDTMQDLLRLV